MSAPAFSIVIPTHNYGHFLPTTLESVLQQGRDDVEIVVVDDASTDDTPEVLAGYGDAVQVLRHDSSLGPGGAWASGLAASRGRFVCKLDADDWQLPGCLDAWEAAFEDPSIGAVAASVYIAYDATGVATRELVTPQDVALDARRFRWRLLSGFFFRMPGFCLRRAALDGHAPPRADLRLPHDWEFFLRVLDGWGGVLLAEPLAVYRIHGASLTTTSHHHDRIRDDIDRLVELWNEDDGPSRLDGHELRVASRALTRVHFELLAGRIGWRAVAQMRSEATWAKDHILAPAGLGAPAAAAAWLRLLSSRARRKLDPRAPHRGRTISDLLPAQ